MAYQNTSKSLQSVLCLPQSAYNSLVQGQTINGVTFNENSLYLTIDDDNYLTTENYSQYCLPITGGTLTGRIDSANTGGMWVAARKNALIRHTTYTPNSSYSPIFSCKTSVGEISNGIIHPNDQLVWSYTADTDFNVNSNNHVQLASLTTAGKFTATTLYGAVWNDYAEFRNYKDSIEIPYGKVVIENGDDSLSLSTERLQKGGNIVSDTFGFAIGETDSCKLPIAVSGRALVYTNEDRYSYGPGDAVCTGPNGTISKMTADEIRNYPDRIIGYVSAIPEYEIWGTGNVKVDGRIWIKVV